MKIYNIRKTHRGGVHPHYNKSATTGKPVEIMPPPQTVYVSLAQHIGAPSKPLVKKGDKVLRGQMIAEAGGYVSVPVHSPVSGTVKSVENSIIVTGRNAPVVTIESDGQNTLHENCKPHIDWTTVSSQELVQIVQNAGIIGMGGAGFPTHVKLSPPAGKKIDTLIINGAECEPYLTADERVMIEYPEKVWKGVEIIRKILGVEHIRIAIEDNKPEAIKAMERTGSSMIGDVAIAVLQSIYPQGAEKQLIYALTEREVPSGGLPMDVGVLVHNVGTTMAICAAVTEGLPLLQRILTISGDCVIQPKNVLAPIGTSISDIVSFCGGLRQEPAKLICGGPMMGITIPSMEPGISKTTSGILLFSSKLVKQFTSMPCISCGRCIRACPMYLMPNELSQFVEAEDWTRAENYSILDCIECGSCAFECPANRPLVQHMKLGKSHVTIIRKERQTKKTTVTTK